MGRRNAGKHIPTHSYSDGRDFSLRLTLTPRRSAGILSDDPRRPDHVVDVHARLATGTALSFLWTGYFWLVRVKDRERPDLRPYVADQEWFLGSTAGSAARSASSSA